jgi:hypothetical protein
MTLDMVLIMFFRGGQNCYLASTSKRNIIGSTHSTATPTMMVVACGGVKKGGLNARY